MENLGPFVTCDCGKKYRINDRHSAESSIRCHVCGRAIDLAYLRQQKAEAERRVRIERAERVNFAGLNFGGVYQSRSPIPIDSKFAAEMELSLNFSDALAVDYSIRGFDDHNGVRVEIEEDSGTVEYEVPGESNIQLSFDTGLWVCEWKGSVDEKSLILTFRIEEYFGISNCGPLSVSEGEGVLDLVLSSPGL